MRFRDIKIKHAETPTLLSLSEKRTGPQKYDGYERKTLEYLTYITLLLILILILLSDIFSTTQQSNYENTHFAEDVKYKFINKSKLDTTKFINTKLNARNVLEIPVMPSLIDELINYYETYIKPNLRKEKYIGPLTGLKGHDFFCVSPPSWNSDIRWISVNNLASYNHFLPHFEKTGLNDIFKKIIDVDSKIVVYSMFFVVRSKITIHNWHIDFEAGTNVNAFTFLTPLQNKSHVHLAYKDINDNSNRYEYKKNVGIVFGENFSHSTDIASNESSEVIFCFSFGTDKMRDWKYIKRTAATQGEHYMHPIHGFSPTTLSPRAPL